MAEFYSIREATKVTGVSATTLKRFVRIIVTDKDHSDRAHVHPSVDEVKRMKAAGKQFTWTISHELLRREFAEEASRSRAAAAGGDEASLREENARLYYQLQIANEQLNVKDVQIAGQMKIIDSLSERIHENNVLIATVQKLPALLEAQTTKATAAKVTTPVKQSTPKRPARKGFFSGLFR